MSRTVHCSKLGKELPGVVYKPFENELGQRIYDHISQDAWQEWLEHSKMLVNEYRLELNTAKAHEVLKEQCEAFLFGEGNVAAPPPDFLPESS